MEEDNEDGGIGRRLRLILRTRGQSLRAFSDQSGVPYRTLQNYVSGSIKPNAEQLAKIFRAGIDLNFLLTGQSYQFARIPAIKREGSEETFAALSDEEIMTAVERRVGWAGNRILSNSIKSGSPFTFEQITAIRQELLSTVLYFIVKADIPFADARKLGMPIDRLLSSALDTAMEAASVKIAEAASRAGRTANPLGTDELRNKVAQ